MHNKIKLPGIGIALLTAISLTGCSGNAQRPVPASPVVTDNGQTESKTPISSAENPSESNANLSMPSSEGNSVESPVNTDSVSINSDVMWAMGKTFDDVTEEYGSVTVEDLNNVYMFENGYGIYVFGDSCKKIGEISAKDFLVGDLSTVTLDNIAEKCGFNVVPGYDTGDSMTMYDGYRFANYTHPDYKNVSFSMMYNENGFDDTAKFSVCNDGYGIILKEENNLSTTVSDSNNSEDTLSVSINSDVIWGIGKTFDEIAERYGDVTSGNHNVYTFENGYGRYAWDTEGIDPTQSDRDVNIEIIRGNGGCKIIDNISIRDFLNGDISTLTLDDLAGKCGFNDITTYPAEDEPYALYNGYRVAYYTHPFYENMTFVMCYKEDGFDEDNATFYIRNNDKI